LGCCKDTRPLMMNRQMKMNDFICQLVRLSIMWFTKKITHSIGRRPFLVLRGLVRDLTDFVYPPVCLLCDESREDHGWLCPECLRRIRDAADPVVHRSDDDFRYLASERRFDGLTACWEFNPDIEQLVHRMKYAGMRNLARSLGKEAAGLLASAGIGFEGIDAFVPVPLHPVRRRERGYNQGERIAAGLASVLGVPVRADLLRRIRKTRTQTDLSGEARQRNVAGAFRAADPGRIRGLSFCLVDDVVTTGATMNECAAALKEAGARQVVGFALARPALRSKGGLKEICFPDPQETDKS
jgi:competence protein ComFC